MRCSPPSRKQISSIVEEGPLAPYYHKCHAHYLILTPAQKCGLTVNIHDESEISWLSSQHVSERPMCMQCTIRIAIRIADCLASTRNILSPMPLGGPLSFALLPLFATTLTPQLTARLLYNSRDGNIARHAAGPGRSGGYEFNAPIPQLNVTYSPSADMMSDKYITRSLAIFIAACS